MRYAGPDLPFSYFVQNAWQLGEPTQRKWRARVIAAIPNFVIGG